MPGGPASPIALKRTAFQDLKRLSLLLAYGIEDSPWRAATGFVAPEPDPPNVSPVRVRTPTAGETLDADVVVIGSGPGGGVTAQVLAAAGRSVLVLERAAMVNEEGFGGPELDGLGSLFLDRGLAATHDRWISIRAASAVGGGSVINWASSLRPAPAVREEWRAAGVGDDLDEHCAAIEADINVNSNESPHNGPNGRRIDVALVGGPAERDERCLRAHRRRVRVPHGGRADPPGPDRNRIPVVGTVQATARR